MIMLVFKALSAVLGYPTAELREALPEISAAIAESPLVATRERDELFALIDEIGEKDLLEAEERYVDLFGRDRGTAMVDLKQLYAAAGFELATRELPDYLPVVLEYLSLKEIAEARDMLADCAHILTAIGRSLVARRSRYAAVIQALLIVAGEQRIDSAKIPPVHERSETLDHDWAEQPAFADTVPPQAG